MTRRLPSRITPWQIDAASKRLRELGLVAPGAILSEDGSSGDNLEATIRWIASGESGEKVGDFADFLARELGCAGPNFEAILLDFVLRLPPAHHMTPGQRIDAVLQALANICRGHQYVDPDLRIDGTCPPDGQGCRLIEWWNNCAGYPRYLEGEVREVQLLFLACGFATDNLIVDGMWGEQSVLSLQRVAELGRQIHERQSKPA